LRKIAGSATGLVDPGGISLDTVDNEIYVSDVHVYSDSISVYSRADSGDVAPLRRIAGTSTGLLYPGRVVVDPVNHEIYVTNYQTNSVFGNSVNVYSQMSSGDVAPIRMISGLSSGLNGPMGIAVDTVNDEIFVANENSNSITVYARTAEGNVAPLRTLSGASAGFAHPTAVAVDIENNELYVAYFSSSSIAVYSRTASGDEVPLRTIAGASTGLNGPNGLIVDVGHNEIIVSNFHAVSITVYSRMASGDAAPLRTLSYPSSGSRNPKGIAMAGNALYGYCAPSYSCASIGCMVPGSTDCGNGHHCSGEMTTCSQTQTAVGNCRPDGSVDCGNGSYCATGTTCVQSAYGLTLCHNEGNTVCSDDSTCPSGYDCASSGCMESGRVDCGNGYSCPSETICDGLEAGDETVCNEISNGGNGGNCSFTLQQCCAGSPGIAAVSCAVDTIYIQACGCPAGTVNGGVAGPNTTWCICP
jgi:DNA-binding beta-propeller fold protein YncE